MESDALDARDRWTEIRVEGRDASGWRRFDARNGRVYRVRRGRVGWIWEVLDANRRTVASGPAATAADGMSQADRA